MLSFFADPYPDELFGSVLARLAEQLRFDSPQTFKQMIFGKKHQRPLLDFPTHLDSILSMLPPKHLYSTDMWINQNSLFTFYSPFISDERARQIRADMKSVDGGKVHLRLGLTRNHIPSLTYLRFCPACTEEDRANYGETYWHRVHHLPGIHACAKHRLWLENTTVDARGVDQIFPAERFVNVNTSRPLELSLAYDRVQLRLAEDAAWLMEHDSLPSDPIGLSQKYLYVLADKGLAPYSGGTLYAQKLLNAVRSFYTDELLIRLNCWLQSHPQSNWVVKLCRQPETTSFPVLHLLFMNFLGYPAAEFFRLPEQPNYFGQGPWPCLNGASHHYLENRITSYELRFSRTSGRQPIARFECDCGFVYERTGPDQGNTDRYKATHVIQYGSTWDERYIQLWNDPSVSRKEMARLLKVSETAIAHQATRLFVSTREYDLLVTVGNPVRGPGREENAAKKEKQRDVYRMKFLEIRVAQPQASRNELRHLVNTEYSWLLRHDKNWLVDHLPPRQYKNTAINRPDPQPRYDWPQIDQELAEQIPHAVRELLEKTGRPKRLTTKALGKHLGKANFFANHLGKLPKTRATLQSVTETYEEYAARRIYWAAKSYLAEGYIPREWELIKRAALRPETVRKPVVQQALQTVIQDLYRVN